MPFPALSQNYTPFQLFIKFFRSQSLKSGKEEDASNMDDYGIGDFDYEVEENSAKYKTLNDKTLLYFITNYRPDKNNSNLVNLVSCV